MKTVQTKQTILHRFCRTSVVLAVVLASGILSSCTKSDVKPTPNDSRLIALSAAVGTISGEVVPTQTKATALNTDALTLYFARADEITPGTYGSYATTALTTTRAAGGGAQQLTFNPVQYYRTDGLKAKLTGWYPGGATAPSETSGNGYYDGTAHTVSWTIDGQQDIMTAPLQHGNSTSDMPSVVFDHRLTQLRFHPYAQTQNAIDAWGKITKIEVLDQQNTVTYTLTADASGAVSFSGDATNSFSAGIAAGGVALSLSTTADKVSNATQMGNPVMIAPQSSSSYVLKLRIVTDKNIMKTITLTQALTAGTPYRLYMCFSELDITIIATVAAWTDVTTDDKLGTARVGDFLNGGLVFWVDPNTPSKYKVMALEESSTKIKWSASNSYLIGVDAQSLTDGRANAVAIKSAYDNKHTIAGVAITQTTFDAAFPAAAYCYNYQGKNGADPKGTWYLPAKNDLQYLWCAYNGAKPVIWDKQNITVAPVNSAAQSKWNNLLTASGVGGTGISNYLTWSGTEHALVTSFAWHIDFSTGYTDNNGRNADYHVRCVRDL